MAFLSGFKPSSIGGKVSIKQQYKQMLQELQKEAMTGAMETAQDLRQNYGKLRIDPNVMMPFGQHSLMPPNPRFQSNTYDTSSEKERIALAMEALRSAFEGAPKGPRGGFAIQGAPSSPYGARRVPSIAEDRALLDLLRMAGQGGK